MISGGYRKYRHVVLYLLFGAVTTIVNILTYILLYDFAGLPNVPSSMAAWLTAVSTAFVTNKLWVFDCRHTTYQETIRELCAFISCRLATGVIDIAIMYVAVDVLNGPATMAKLGADIVVILLNYTGSRLWVFRKKTHVRDNKGGMF